MAYINWVTEKGSIGLFPSKVLLSYSFIAESTLVGMDLKYKLLNGTLPIDINGNSFSLSENGNMQGTPNVVNGETIYTFTVRAYDTVGNISDRTFSIKINNPQIVYINTPPGMLLTEEDSVYIDYQIEVYNPITTNVYSLTISSGNLPDGLQMSSSGRITGYALPPVSSITGAPIIKTSNFTVQLYSELGYDTKDYYITINNHNILNPNNTRIPVILNNKPLHVPVDIHDIYFGYYTNGNNLLPTIQSDEYFSFKVIGHNFDTDSISYLFGTLPSGLSGDTSTGWITGTPTIPLNTISSYDIQVMVAKTNNTLIRSQPETFTLVIANNMIQDVEWVTDNNLGIIDNGSVSQFAIEATSSYDLIYRVTAGALPPNLTLQTNGEIIGIVPFQCDTNNLMAQGDSITFTFTVSAYNLQFPVIASDREFTITVYQKYNKPIENIYFKASPNVQGRQILQSLLTDETLIPTEYLYRPDDSNFGKADSVKYYHIYGIESTSIQTYLDAINYNHYYRKVILGELKTARALDDYGNVQYEVVYSEIVDPLINANGQTLPQTLGWPRKIPLNEGPWFTSKSSINTSSAYVFTSYDYGSTRVLYPASVTNMRNELLSRMNHSDNQDLLPKWMTSQQTNGGTLGFTNAWVICYTLPGYSETIKNNINNNWQYKLNMIDFSIDRFIVDKRATYNFNTNLVIPTWTELPSNTPTPDPVDTYDLVVLFDQKTILPNRNDY